VRDCHLCWTRYDTTLCIAHPYRLSADCTAPDDHHSREVGLVRVDERDDLTRLECGGRGGVHGCVKGDAEIELRRDQVDLRSADGELSLCVFV
jgi:hypothetical protein